MLAFLLVTFVLYSGTDGKTYLMMETTQVCKENQRKMDLTCTLHYMERKHETCYDIWWTHEIDNRTHREEPVSVETYKMLLKDVHDYVSEMEIRNLQVTGTYSCRARCGSHTYTATCDMHNYRTSCDAANIPVNKVTCSHQSYHVQEGPEKSAEDTPNVLALNIVPIITVIVVVVVVSVIARAVYLRVRRKRRPTYAANFAALRSTDTSLLCPPTTLEGRPPTPDPPRYQPWVWLPINVQGCKDVDRSVPSGIAAATCANGERCPHIKDTSVDSLAECACTCRGKAKLDWEKELEAETKAASCPDVSKSKLSL